MVVYLWSNLITTSPKTLGKSIFMRLGHSDFKFLGKKNSSNNISTSISKIRSPLFQFCRSIEFGEAARGHRYPSTLTLAIPVSCSLSRTENHDDDGWRLTAMVRQGSMSGIVGDKMSPYLLACSFFGLVDCVPCSCEVKLWQREIQLEFLFTA